MMYLIMFSGRCQTRRSIKTRMDRPRPSKQISQDFTGERKQPQDVQHLNYAYGETRQPSQKLIESIR